jgi:superfamily II DNA/RNA helicase
MSFDTLGLPEALVRAVTDSGYTTLTEVQTRAILSALEGKDLMISASTSSGKTASFVLPSLQCILLARADSTKKREKGMVYGPHILVLTPIRELSMQVDKAATPGRLMDHMQSGKAILENVEMLVLDEADRMLNMVFIDDIRHIVEQLPQNRQTVMYSATFGDHVGRLAQDLLRDSMRIDISSHTDTHENIEQRLHWADNKSHKDVLLDHILTEREMEQALVFTSAQRDVDADRLADMDHAVVSLYGGMPQGRRTSALTTVTTACSSPTARQLSVVRLIGYPSIATPPALLRASRPVRL